MCDICATHLFGYGLFGTGNNGNLTSVGPLGHSVSHLLDPLYDTTFSHSLFVVRLPRMRGEGGGGGGDGTHSLNDP